MNSVLPEKSEIGIWYKKVEFELDRFIFVAPKPMPEEEWTRLCEQYGQRLCLLLFGKWGRLLEPGLPSVCYLADC
jgi:hypothetical protein